MLSFSEMIQQGPSHAWFFIPSAIGLGALHGLEPGHSKTMMAAFIVAIRGTIGQAFLLGIAATISHTLIVWGIALGGMYWWHGVETKATEPYFQLASAIIIVTLALWMLLRTLKEQRLQKATFQGQHYDHHPHDESRYIATGNDAPPHNRVAAKLRGGEEAGAAYQDAHELAHAHDIRRRFANRNVTHWQIVLFGLTGGLVPCPAAITVLLLCLQLSKISLGAILVLGFSVGLALTLVAVGVAAAWSVRHINKRCSGFSTLAHRVPYLSNLLIIAVGIYVGFHGWVGLQALT
jgi:nickel/cobalt exporter